MTTSKALLLRDRPPEDMREQVIQELDVRGDGKHGLPTSDHRGYVILYEFHEAHNLLDRFLVVFPTAIKL
jgi:hypothetical protein